MRTTGAEIAKAYLEKYVCINLLKTKKNQHADQSLARISLSISFHAINELNHLIFSNNANDIEQIKKTLKQAVNAMHFELRRRQSMWAWMFNKTILPSDFGKCIYEAWFRLQYFEKQYLPKKSQETQLENHED